MSALGTRLVAEELAQALDVLAVDHSKLPEVRDKDGQVITDVREKRLALVKLHLDAAGDILLACEEIENAAMMATETWLARVHPATLMTVLSRMKLAGQPMPPQPAPDTTENSRKFGF